MKNVLNILTKLMIAVRGRLYLFCDLKSRDLKLSKLVIEFCVVGGKRNYFAPADADSCLLLSKLCFCGHSHHQLL